MCRSLTIKIKDEQPAQQVIDLFGMMIGPRRQLAAELELGDGHRRDTEPTGLGLEMGFQSG